ncbi:MAG: HlyC/CorC family transporter [Gemmatimonadetes bacterium]|nr:HlyC/CorC family transporter [Gemmatimonadota bacterium]
MSGWVMTVVGLTLAVCGTTIAVAAAAVSRLELARWISHRLRGAAIASALLSTPGRLLGSAGAVATLGVVLAAMGLNAVLATVPPLARASLVVLLAVPLVIVVTLGLPRAVAHRWPEWIIRRSGPAMERASRVFAALLPGADATPRASLAAMVRAGQHEGVLETDELTVFSGVVAFAERSVREVMTPRTDIVAVPENAPITDVARMLGESGYSRLPVYRDSLDNIVGMVYAFDLLTARPEGRLPVRPVSVVPASRRCADLLFEMQREGRQFAVVLDEFGGTAGIATFEDLLEELVGEIFDEHDQRPPSDLPAVELVEVDAATPASDIGARFGVALPRDAGTLGGMLARGAGRIPQAGERFTLAGLEFDVLAATPTRVERVAVRRGPVPAVPLATGGRP